MAKFSSNWPVKSTLTADQSQVKPALNLFPELTDLSVTVEQKLQKTPSFTALPSTSLEN